MCCLVVFEVSQVVWGLVLVVAFAKDSCWVQVLVQVCFVFCCFLGVCFCANGFYVF